MPSTFNVSETSLVTNCDGTVLDKMLEIRQYRAALVQRLKGTVVRTGKHQGTVTQVNENGEFLIQNETSEVVKTKLSANIVRQLLDDTTKR